MNQTKKISWVLINLLGGSAVIGSYVYGFLTRTEAPQVLWGGVPAGLRPFYTAWMLPAAVGYLALAYFVFRLDPGEIKVFGHFDFTIFNVLYLLILVPSALWMPLTLLAIEHSSAVLLWMVRMDLALVAVGSLGLLLVVLNIRPRPLNWLRLLAIFGSVVFCLQTVILDAIVWSIYFHG